MACWNWARKVSVGVMVAGEEVHRSLAPSRMVTYRAPWLTAWVAWLGAAAILAPETASLAACPAIAGLTRLMRSQWLAMPS
jgi:hypothetical protein